MYWLPPSHINHASANGVFVSGCYGDRNRSGRAPAVPRKVEGAGKEHLGLVV